MATRGSSRLPSFANESRPADETSPSNLTTAELGTGVPYVERLTRPTNHARFHDANQRQHVSGTRHYMPCERSIRSTASG